MKDKTKNLLMLGGVGVAGIAALYFLVPSEAAEEGGFGGGGGIPLLPGDTEDAAESVADVIYNLGGAVADPFGGFGEVEPTKKEGRELLTKEAVERGQIIEWDVEMAPTGAELMKKAEIMPEEAPGKTIVEDIINWAASTPGEKGTDLREMFVGSVKQYGESRIVRTTKGVDLLGGILTGRDVGLTKTYSRYKESQVKKAARVTLEKEAVTRSQTIRWDVGTKKRVLTPGQRSIQQESEAHGQTVVYD